MRISRVLTIMFVLVLSAISYAVPTQVKYQLSIDDYVQMYIDGQLVASYDDYPAATVYAILTLDEGWHDISIIYKNRWGSNGLFLGDVVAAAAVPGDHLRSVDGQGSLIQGLTAKYYDLNGNHLLTVYGEGPISHWSHYDDNGVWRSGYQDVFPAAWAGVFDGWSKFEERLTGQILVGQNPQPVASLVDRGNGLIYDSGSNITWLRNANYAQTPRSWYETVIWAANLLYGGYDDWRLPTNEEMQSLFYDRLGNTFGWHAHNTGPFENVQPSVYWTGTGTFANYAIFMNWANGDTGQQDKGFPCYMWAVRDGDSSGETSEPPVAYDQMVTTNENTPVAITVNASDPGGHPIAYSLVTAPSQGTLNGTLPSVTYTPNAGYYGPDSFTFKVSNGLDESNIGTVGIDVVETVQDTTPPSINYISASPEVLWPANNKMVEVTLTIDAQDNTDPAPSCRIVGVTCNEPTSGPGNKDPDWQYSSDSLVILLRAERAGSGTGRVYTIHVACADTSGNTAGATTQVTVPHDQGGATGRK